LEILQQSDRRQTSLLDRDSGDLRRDREAKNSIILTWQISFDYINQTRSSAADLLSLMSFFDRHTIPEHLIREACRSAVKDARDGGRDKQDDNESTQAAEDNKIKDGNNNEFEDDIDTLRGFSFILITTDTTSFEMHRLVQLAT
jgi:hypothetical protein